MKKIILLILAPFCFGLSDPLTTDQATIFLSHYLQKPIQNWPKTIPTESDIPAGEHGDLIRQGIKLLEHTSKYAGPKAINPNNRLSQNNLNCVQCHVPGTSGLPGTRAGQLPYINVVHEYPKLDVKSMKVISLQDRIRGMFGGGNGRLTDDSFQMKAMMAYFSWLGSYSKSGARMNGTFLKPLPLPKIAASPKRGKPLYIKNCATCHGDKGLGVETMDFDKGGGYLMPPLAGNDTYTDGGHMYLIPIMARFIYGYMPLGATSEKPQLAPQDAYDIAAYINTDLPRKKDANRKNHYPNNAFRPGYIEKKYGPWTGKELQDFR